MTYTPGTRVWYHSRLRAILGDTRGTVARVLTDVTTKRDVHVRWDSGHMVWVESASIERVDAVTQLGDLGQDHA